jgi:hypothetical protein
MGVVFRRKKQDKQGGANKPTGEFTYKRIPRKFDDKKDVFKTNRTLVGSVSSRIRSVSEHSGDLQSPRIHAHHLNAHRRRLSVMLIGVIGAMCVLVWVLYQFTAGIDISVRSDTVNVDKKRYQATINEYLNHHPTERFRLALDSSNLTAYMQENSPEVLSVRSDGASGIGSSLFHVEFRQPVAGWLIGVKQLYVDENGVSFSVNNYAEPSVKIVDKSGVSQTSGTVVASNRFLRFVGRSVTVAKQFNIGISEAIIPPNTTHQIDLVLSGGKYPVKLSLDRPVGEQIEDLSHVIAYLGSHSITPEYIDVRVSGKAYYK